MYCMQTEGYTVCVDIHTLKTIPAHWANILGWMLFHIPFLKFLFLLIISLCIVLLRVLTGFTGWSIFCFTSSTTLYGLFVFFFSSESGYLSCSFDDGLCGWIRDRDGDLHWETTPDPSGNWGAGVTCFISKLKWEKLCSFYWYTHMQVLTHTIQAVQSCSA